MYIIARRQNPDMYSLIVSVVTACYKKRKNLTQYMYTNGTRGGAVG